MLHGAQVSVCKTEASKAEIWAGRQQGHREGVRHRDPEQNTNVALHRTIIEDRKRSHKKRKLQNN